MGRKNSKKKKVNKGPKGKKARAKAKLERQWGEVPLDPDEGAIRRGATTSSTTTRRPIATTSTTTREKGPRLLAAQPLEKNLVDELKGSNASDKEEANEKDEEENLVESFLQRLQKKRRREAGDDDDASVINEGEQEHNETGRTMAVDVEQSESDDEEEDDIPVVDLFAQRFALSPPFDEANASATVATAQQTQTIAAAETLHLEPGTELQVSTQWLEARHNRDKDAHQYRWWRRQSKAAFGCNRDFLKQNWQQQQKQPTKTRNNKRPLGFSPLQTVAYPLLTAYQDLLWVTNNHAQQRLDARRLTALHMLNHVWTSRHRIAKHTKRLLQRQKIQQRNSGQDDDDDAFREDDDEEEVNRDQGFTRPTVLVLLPTRNECFVFVQLLQALLLGESFSDRQKHPLQWDRFVEEFGPPPPPPDEDDAARVEKLRRRSRVLEGKGREWLDLFGDDVNDDDHFQLGVSVNLQKMSKKKKKKQQKRKEQQDDEEDDDDTATAALRLYTDFYKSDMILASPLGLKMSCTRKSGNDDNEEDENELENTVADDDAQIDFLSSIEICVLLRAEVLLMQNWDHVNDVLQWLNHAPKDSQRTDFSRVRPYLLTTPLQARHWRQLVLTTDFMDPLLQATFKRFAQSGAGLARIRRRTTVQQAGLSQVLAVKATQVVFQRVPARSLASQAQDKFDYFCKHVLMDLSPISSRGGRKHVLLLIPSYFDYVAIRNALLRNDDAWQEQDFGSVTEYARPTEVWRTRTRFAQGKCRLLLYTGRAHFFHRHDIKRVRHLIFYGVPERVDTFVDLVNGLAQGDDHNGKDDEDESSRQRSCLVLFSKYDSHALERVVGFDNCKRMIKTSGMDNKDTFVFGS